MPGFLRSRAWALGKVGVSCLRAACVQEGGGRFGEGGVTERQGWKLSPCVEPPEGELREGARVCIQMGQSAGGSGRRAGFWFAD